MPTVIETPFLLNEDKGQRFSPNFFSLADQQMSFSSKYWLSCFAHFGRDLSHAQNQILYHGFLFCNLFTSGKYFQLFVIIKDSVQWKIFQVLNQEFHFSCFKEHFLFFLLFFETDLSRVKVFSSSFTFFLHFT